MPKLCFGILTVVTICCFSRIAAAQPRPDLRIEKFSVSSTLVGADGLRRVTVSFRILNDGDADSGASRTRITMAANSIDYNTPALVRGASAFISRGVRTIAGQVPISVQADVLNGVTEKDEQNNATQTTAQLRVEEGRWISIGPSRIRNFRPEGIGRITAIAVSPTSLFVVYAGARGTGLWKTIDASGNWYPIGDSLPSLQIDAIAIDPRDSEHVFVATPAGLFESRNGGSVWTVLTMLDLAAVGSGGGAFLIPNTFNPPMYLTTRTGLLVSTDGGRNWRLALGNGNSPVISLQFSTGDQTRLYASRTNPPAIFETTNGGLTPGSWRQLQGCSGGAIPAMPADAKIWVAESKGQMYLSFRGKNGDDKVNEIWRSTNTSCSVGGIIEQSWEKVSLSGACKEFANHFSYLFAHPTNPEILFKGGIELCRSSQSGSQMGTVGNVHVDHHAIAVAPSAPAVMFFGSDGGIYRSPDRGATLHFISEGLSTTEFLSMDTDGADSKVAVGGTQDNGFSTWDGLTSEWKYVHGGDSSIVKFDIADPTKIYETGQSTRQITRHPGSSGLGNSTLPDLCSYSEFPGNTGFPAHLLTNMISIGGNRLAVTAHGLWVGPPWVEIHPPEQNVTPGEGCDRVRTGDFTRLKMGPTGGLMAAVTNTGRVFFGLPHQPPLAQVADLDTTSPTAIAFAGPGTFYVSFDTDGQASIFRLQCFAGCTRKKICSDNDPIVKCPGNVPAIQNTQSGITAMVVDPSSPDTLLVAVRNRGIFRGTPDSALKFTWTEFNYGLPAGIIVTELKARKNGSIIAATYGRGAYELFPRVQEPTPPPSVTGRIVFIESERLDPNKPPGSTNPTLTTVEIDSKPGWIFSTSTLGVGNRLKAAASSQRRVRLTFQIITNGSGRILTVTTLP